MKTVGGRSLVMREASSIYTGISLVSSYPISHQPVVSADRPKTLGLSLAVNQYSRNSHLAKERDLRRHTGSNSQSEVCSSSWFDPIPL